MAKEIFLSSHHRRYFASSWHSQDTWALCHNLYLIVLLQELYSSPQLKNSYSHFKYAATKWQSCKGRLIRTWESCGAAWVGGRVLSDSTLASTNSLKTANLTVTQSYISLVSSISPLRIKVLRNGNIYTYEARIVLFKVIALDQW